MSNYAENAPTPEQEKGLEVCIACKKDMMQLSEVDDLGDELCIVSMNCANCGWDREDVVSTEALVKFGRRHLASQHSLFESAKKQGIKDLNFKQFPESNLHICDGCNSDFVSPITYDYLGNEKFWMLIRCGVCEMSKEVIVTQSVADSYEKNLEETSKPINYQKAVMKAEREEREAQVLIQELQSGEITVDSFKKNSQE
jgi:transcription elongation factor Elf1